MSKVVTTRQQYANLLELLQQKPEIAQGFSKCSKEEVTEFWQNVAKELNSLGPPIKDVSSWKKVWLDWKAYIKRKLSENKREQAATGGGRNRQHNFNDLEEQVIKLTALETSTHGIKGTASVGLPSAGEVESREADPDVSMLSENCSRGLPRRAPNVQKRADTSSAELLKEQLELQKDFQQKSLEHFAHQNAKLDVLASNMQRLCSAVERMCDVKAAELEETRRYHRHMQNLNVSKNNTKQQMLEVEQRSFEKLSKK